MLARDSRTQALSLRQPREAFPITIILPTQTHSFLGAGFVNLSRDAPSSEGGCAVLELILCSASSSGSSQLCLTLRQFLGFRMKQGLYSGVQEMPSWLGVQLSVEYSKDTSDTWAVIWVHLLFMLGGKPAVFLAGNIVQVKGLGRSTQF